MIGIKFARPRLRRYPGCHHRLGTDSLRMYAGLGAVECQRSSMQQRLFPVVHGPTPAAGKLRRPMSKFIVKWLPVLALLLFYAAPARAQQQQISGRVTAAGSREPIAGAYVRLRGRSASVRTDASGRYTLAAPAPSGVLVLSRIGFASREV